MYEKRSCWPTNCSTTSCANRSSRTRSHRTTRDPEPHLVPVCSCGALCAHCDSFCAALGLLPSRVRTSMSCLSTRTTVVSLRFASLWFLVIACLSFSSRIDAADARCLSTDSTIWQDYALWHSIADSTSNCRFVPRPVYRFDWLFHRIPHS